MSAAPAKTDAPPPASKKKKRKLMLVALALLGMGGGGGFWYLSGHGAKAETPKQLPPQYISLEPAFVVNLTDADAMRYLQADVQMLTRDPATAAAVELHRPVIRNRLLMLFGQHSSQQLNGRRGKEQLQQAALTEVRAVLKAQQADSKVDSVFFTSFVTQ